MLIKIGLLYMQSKFWLRKFAKEERGDFGIGQIVAIVATIVVIGLIITAISGKLDGWIDTVWNGVSSMLGGDS